MSHLVRGFKAEAERLVVTLRTELGITVHDRLDPIALADLYGIPVLSLTDLGLPPPALRHFRIGAGRDEFSGATLIAGPRRRVIYNPWHAAARRASSVSHEISHVLLEHEPDLSVVQGQQRLWNPRMEEEATWLAAALLVPADAALEIAKSGRPVDEAAAAFGVSRQLMEWRLNQTGARIRAQRSRARR